MSARGNSLGLTNNFEKASVFPAKTLAVKTSVNALKPRRYATTGRK